jgi:multidrug efflux pump subunit AcrA (membrane-fusion protein)
MVPSEAVQRIGDRNVVFIPREGEPRSFEVRDVELGGVADGYQRVLSGLQVGERVVTKGSFTLKTQLMKSSLGDEH